MTLVADIIGARGGRRDLATRNLCGVIAPRLLGARLYFVVQALAGFNPFVSPQQVHLPPLSRTPAIEDARFPGRNPMQHDYSFARHYILVAPGPRVGM